MTTAHHDHDHEGAVMREFGLATRVISQAMSRLREQRARERELQRRRAERESDERSRQIQARLAAEQTAVEAQLQPAFSPGYLEGKTAQEIAETYELARVWGQESPTAEAAAAAIRRDFEKLTGIDLEDPASREQARRESASLERAVVQDVVSAKDREETDAEAAREEGNLATSKHDPTQDLNLRDLLIDSGTPEEAVDARIDALHGFPSPIDTILDQKPPTPGLRDDGDDYGLDTGRERDIER